MGSPMARVRRCVFSFRKRTRFSARGRCLHALFVLALLLHAALSPQSAQAARQIPAGQIQDALPCKPFLEWMLDPGGKLSIQEISSPERQTAFASLDTRFPPHQAGTLWLRFTLGPRALESRPATLLLDMGNGVPGTPLLFVAKNTPFTSATEWQDIQPSRRSIFLLPDAQATPQTMYLRLEGLPDPWFAPVLRTPHNAATAPERMIHPAILVALGVVMLLCLLRGLTERGQWRIWTSLYIGAALVYAVCGMPAVPEGIVPIRELPGVLAPGIALMLLPHVGRHLMQTRDKARGLDIQYLLLSLPGAALALLPLVPGFAWTSYYLALWPLATALLVPTSLGAWLSGLPGARRFLLACLVSMIGATAGILSMYALAPFPLLPAGPLLGVTLGALFIAGTAIPKDYALEVSGRESTKAQEAFASEESGLRLLPPEELPEAAPPPAETPHTPATPPQPTTPVQPLSVRDAENSSALAGRLRPHLDSLLRESAGIAVCALPPAARQHAEAITGLGRAMTSLLDNAALGMTLERSPAHTAFDLQQLLREAHEQPAGEAERKGLNVSWFMPPHLPRYYSGNAKGISQVIRLLLESSIRATRQGFVQLTVRRVPESVNPGHLLFSISDSGSGMPPHTRNALALARAWELAGAQGGSMSAESGVRGSVINFTLQLKPQPASQMETDVAAQARRVILIDELSSNRQLLAFFLEGLPCILEEARSVEEAAQACQTECAALLLIDCDMPETDNLNALSAFFARERERELPATPVLALESEGGAWEGLNSLENVHRLVKPVTRSRLREKVWEILTQHAVPHMPGIHPARHEESAQDAELPLDLPPPIEYGPGLAPGGGQFIPLSLDPNLSLASVTATTPLPAQETHPARTSPSPAPRFENSRGMAFSAKSGPMQTSAHPPTPFAGFPPEMEWVGEPVPVAQTQEHASLEPQQDGLLDWIDGARASQTMPQPAPPPAHNTGWSRSIPAVRPAPTQSAPPAAYDTHPQYGYQPMDEWVGEPMPAPQRQEHASLLRPFDRHAAQPAQPEELMEEMAHQPSPPSRLQQGGLLDWVDGARISQTMPQPAPPPAHNAGWNRTAPPAQPAPIQSVPSAVYGAHPQYGSRAPYPAAAYYDPGEWVGEPTPMPPRAESPPVSRAAASAPPYAAGERVGDPTPLVTAQTAPRPRQHDFIPLRLTDPPPLSPAPVKPADPEPPAVPAPLFPEDGSLLGFVLKRPGKDTGKAGAAPPQPTVLAQAAKGLVNLVRTRTDSPSAKKEQPEPAALRKTETVAMERPSAVHSSSAVEQMQPLIPGLLSSLDEAMADVRRGFRQADTIAVEEAAARIAAKADNYGLRILARMARCVEMAAKARDKDALANILPDLDTAVERNRIALQPKQ